MLDVLVLREVVREHVMLIVLSAPPFIGEAAREWDVDLGEFLENWIAIVIHRV